MPVSIHDFRALQNPGQVLPIILCHLSQKKPLRFNNRSHVPIRTPVPTVILPAASGRLSRQSALRLPLFLRFTVYTILPPESRRAGTGGNGRLGFTHPHPAEGDRSNREGYRLERMGTGRIRK